MSKFGLDKRFSSFEVEVLTNGFVLQVSGKDEDDNYKQTKTYCANLQQLSEFIATVIALPED